MTQAAAAMEKRVHLPDFWSGSPDLWFIRVEGEFVLKGIATEEARHAHVVAALKEEHALRVQDTLRAPDQESPYTKLKKSLLAAYSLSDHQKACAILDMKPSQSERPTEVLDKMVSLLPATVDQADPGWLFKAVFLRLLPPDVAQHLVAQSFDSMRTMAMQANHLFESRARQVFSVAALPTGEPSPPPPLGGAEGVPPAQPPPAPCTASHACCPVNAVYKKRDNGTWCWYHKQFRDKATRCEPGCAWRPRQAGNANGRRR